MTLHGNEDLVQALARATARTAVEMESPILRPLRNDKNNSPTVSSSSSPDIDNIGTIKSSPKRMTNLRELEAVMGNASHFNFREGLAWRSDHGRLRARAAVFFQVTKNASNHTEMRYLPLVVSKPAPLQPVAASQLATQAIQRLQVLPSTQQYIDQSRQSLQTTVQWPPDVPVEIFAMITQTLSFRDIRNMRLVSRDFDHKTSPALFKEVIVPFTAELYDMIEDDVSARLNGFSFRSARSKGKTQTGSFPALPAGPDSYSAYNRISDNTVPKNGLRVFQNFGHHMNKFGIRFEVTETDLVSAPTKQIHCKRVGAYHGEYVWPLSDYSRFGRLANLERTADETPRMTAALAMLANVREIGLSLDSGLGYLNGPDRSHHDILFDRHSSVFEIANMNQHPRSDGAENFWSCLRKSHDSFAGHDSIVGERLMACILASDSTGKYPELPSAAHEDTALWPSFKTNGGILAGSKTKISDEPLRGILYTTRDEVESSERQNTASPPLSPEHLTSQQKQWLLETGWAQSAFLDTYILALADNPMIFHKVAKVSISKISSGLLAKLDHRSFWDALPNIEHVTLLVSPDWRTVRKGDAGCAETRAIRPSLAVETLHSVFSRILLLDNLRKLRIGYADGGERGKGMFGRNSNLMPAPAAKPDQLLSPTPEVVAVDHIEDLTLVNCWMTPRALIAIATTQTLASVPDRILALESVSLTANTQPERQDFKFDVGTVHELRESCWPALIDGLKHYLGKITFQSCGYAILPYMMSTFDQSALDFSGAIHFASPGPIVFESEWFRRRAELLDAHTMRYRDEYLGRIFPYMSAKEIAVLNAWQIGPIAGDMVAEYDGMPRAGTGRFTGMIEF